MPARDRFIHDRDTGRHRHCSPLLVNAVAALGCRYSDRPEVKTYLECGEKFFLEAERLWDKEQGDLSLTTIQATALMSLWQASHGRDSEGFFFARQAICMAVEMGLHKPLTDGPALEVDLEARNATFWGTFVLDQVWSLCLGRLPHVSSRGRFLLPTISVNKEERVPWESYVDKGTPLFSSSLRATNDQVMFQGLCELSKIAHRSLHFLYSPRESITSRDVLKIYSQYLDWYSGIEEGTGNGANSTPTALFTHMYYHFSILLLFSPLIRLRFLDSSVVPCEICAQAANAISSLVQTYRELHSLRRTFSFMPHVSLAASIVHLVAADTHGSYLEGSFTKVLRGISELHDMTASHVFAGRGKDSLRSMANRSLIGAGWLQDNEGDHCTPFRSVESILPRKSIALESSIFSPYPSQVLVRAGISGLRQTNGFEILDFVG